MVTQDIHGSVQLRWLQWQAPDRTATQRERERNALNALQKHPSREQVVISKDQFELKEGTEGKHATCQKNHGMDDVMVITGVSYSTLDSYKGKTLNDSFKRSSGH